MKHDQKHDGEDGILDETSPREVLAASELRYRRLFESAKDGILILDAETGMIVDVNPFLTNLLGYSREEFLDKRIWELGFFKQLAANAEKFAELQAREYVRYEDLPLETVAGHIREVEFVSNVYLAGGKRVIQCNIRDITERKRADAYRRMTQDVLHHLNEEKEWPEIIQQVIGSLKSYTGCHAVEVLLQEGEVLPDKLKDMQNNEYASVTLIPIPTKDRIAGQLRFSDRQKDRFSPESVVALEGIASHIGSAWLRHLAEASQAVLADQLCHTQKMEAVGRLAGGVAHDFNNAMMVIMGNVELLRGQNGVGGPARELLDQIMTAATRVTETSMQLLTFARKQVVKPTIVNLNATVGGMVKLLSRLIGENIELIWQPGENLWDTKIDPAQIDLIMVNLLVNARDAIARGGKVTLETENVTMDFSGDLGPVKAQSGDYVLLAVSDTGCGMDKATQSHIFEPFFTTKGAGKGTGLGLATVYGVVQQNRGHIHLASEPGKGTTFKIYLPRETESATKRSDAKSPSHASGGQGETILLVEDEESVRMVCERFLKSDGYSVTVASSPEQALVLAGHSYNPFDLLLTDIVMPGLNGIELSQRLKKIQPDLNVLFMSGYPSESLSQRDLPDDAAFISKPFLRNELLQKVRAVLNAGVTGSPLTNRVPHLDGLHTKSQEQESPPSGKSQTVRKAEHEEVARPNEG